MNEPVIIVLGALLAVSEALALIPSIKSNSLFQLMVNMVKSILSIKKS